MSTDEVDSRLLAGGVYTGADKFLAYTLGLAEGEADFLLAGVVRVVSEEWELTASVSCLVG